MSCSIPAIIRACVAPKHNLSMPSSLWQEGLAELRRRGEGRRESGAFLLGHIARSRRRAIRFIYYDDIEPRCLDRGYVVFDGTGYGALWSLCRATGLRVVADIHTHPLGAHQSASDRDHPMIAIQDHIAIIVPNYARPPVRLTELGIYVYDGKQSWRTFEGSAATQFLYTGLWG